jgi:hypothetical protein
VTEIASRDAPDNTPLRRWALIDDVIVTQAIETAAGLSVAATAIQDRRLSVDAVV